MALVGFSADPSLVQFVRTGATTPSSVLVEQTQASLLEVHNESEKSARELAIEKIRQRAINFILDGLPWKNDLEFNIDAVRTNPEAFFCLSPDMRRDPEIRRLAHRPEIWGETNSTGNS